MHTVRDAIFAPGKAWEYAKVYLAAGNLEEADKLREHMLKSDARLMKERIEKVDPNFYAKGVK